MFSSPKATSFVDPAEDDLILGILEEGCDLAGEIGGPEPPRVQAGDHDPALEAPAVEVRDEARERAQECRLARARRAEERHDLARLDPKRDVRERGLLRAPGRRT